MSALAALALAAQATTSQGSTTLNSVPVGAQSTSDSISRGSITYVDLEAGAGYSTRPELVTSGGGSAFARISARGVHTRVSDRTTTVITGFVQGQFYSNSQSSQKTLDLTASHNLRATESLSVFGDVSLGYDEGGQFFNRVFTSADVPPAPGVLQPPIFVDRNADLFSLNAKTYHAGAHVGGQQALSARDFLSLTTGLSRVITKNGVVETRYTTIPVSLSWDRQLSSRTTLGVRINVVNTNYDGPASVRSFSPQVTIQTLLTENLSLNGAVGVAFARTRDGIRSRHSTGPSANISLCKRGERDNLCAHAAIDQEAATAAGPARTVSLGVDYSRRLDADQTVAFSLSANRYSNPTLIGAGYSFRKATYLQAAGDYSRRIGNRLFAGASLSARKVDQSGSDSKADFSGSLFIRYRLGDIR